MSSTPFAVILCQFNDVAIPDIPMSQFTDLITSGGGGLYDYWSNVSYTQNTLTGSKVFGWWTMKYSYINDGTLGRGAWIAEAKRLAGLNGVDLSPFYGVIAVINANADDSDDGRDLAVGIGGTWGQQNWKWCNKCQALAYAGSGTGVCAAGGTHDQSGSSLYSLALDQPAFPGQSNWRWCKNCQVLNYGGNPPGPCPAGGVHDYSKSGNYSLGSGKVGYPGQNGWMWCLKCQGLVYAGSGATPGKCSGGGVHDTSKSANYTLVQNSSNLNMSFCAHESGHALGLGHSWYSPPESPTASPEVEYGDPWDIMSAMAVNNFSSTKFPPAGPGPNAPNLDFLGWIPSFAAWTNGPSQSNTETIQLLALNEPTLGLLTAKAAKADSTYYVEYRQNTLWDQGFSGNLVSINEVRLWQWCTKCQVLTRVGGIDAGPCPGGGKHDHTGSSWYTLLHKPPAGHSYPTQSGWQWCNKCQSLTYAGSGVSGACSGGGKHDHTSSNDYTLVHDTANYGQSDWRWCSKCYALAYAGGSGGPCAAGGVHDTSSSFNYDVINDTRHSFLMSNTAGRKNWQPGEVFADKNRGLGIVVHAFNPSPVTATVSVVNLQVQWMWCKKCQGLAYAGNSAGVCPTGGGHDSSSSTNYSLIHDLPGSIGQNKWRWCSKCQGLAYSGNPTTGVCPAGGTHHLTASYDYMLLHDTPMTDAQKNWRWCDKCQGLAYAGTSSGVCPAGAAHDLTHSADYNMINV
jgi:hypothetical protein